jgi:hypothetical protein
VTVFEMFTKAVARADVVREARSPSVARTSPEHAATHMPFAVTNDLDEVELFKPLHLRRRNPVRKLAAGRVKGDLFGHTNTRVPCESAG